MVCGHVQNLVTLSFTFIYYYTSRLKPIIEYHLDVQNGLFPCLSIYISIFLPIYLSIYPGIVCASGSEPVYPESLSSKFEYQ